jgi:hypothetical protein
MLNAAVLEAHRASEHFQGLVMGEIVSLLKSREPLLASMLKFGA